MTEHKTETGMFGVNAMGNPIRTRECAERQAETAPREPGPCAHTWTEGTNVCMVCGTVLTFEDADDGLTDELIDTLGERLGEVSYDNLRLIIERRPEAERRAHYTEASRQVLRDLGLGVINPPASETCEGA